ncbi:MAG: DUF5690 family protein [Verrucomicrobiales bacterium]|jgi:hypothetical protein|nr:DUF5690 family protein [Verrucomicrobiales bacterium]
MATSPLNRKLTQAPTWAFTAYAIFAAFTTYLCMYGFRKGFSVGTYEEQSAGFFGSVFALKSAMVISQVIGYALSKYIGVKVNSEMPKSIRGLALIGSIVVAQLALLAVALLPSTGKALAMFFNGLPLGMVWGMVFSFLEGRRLTELLGAGLCCAFIVGSACAKFIGQTLIDAGVPEHWMPFAVGLCYLPVFLLSVWLLCQLPNPSSQDESARVRREPMDRKARQRFLMVYFPGLIAGFLTYIALTVCRDYRDNFLKELLGDEELGASIFLKLDLPIAIAVLSIVALLFLVRDNRRGFFLTHVCALTGTILLGGCTYLHARGAIGNSSWMFWSGFGTFLAYVPFNCIFYDRMIAALGTVATAVFCIMMADALGYTAVIGVLTYEQMTGGPGGSKVEFFHQLCYATSVIGSICLVGSWLFFRTKTKASS